MYKSIVKGIGGITAKVVADSIANDVRLTTLELRYPRFIHSEFMTHRMFSRNASSSRAIPVKKMIEQVEKDPAMPIHWGESKSGMQADNELPILSIRQCRQEWYRVRDSVIKGAEFLNYCFLHKQTINRLLEPFQFISVIVTATEWDNFFELRLHPDAQPEIQELARCMKEAMDNSTPNILERGEYHAPYITEEEITGRAELGEELTTEDWIKCSAARCARVSYMNHDKTDANVEKDLQLANQLLESRHMSPFEHIATPMSETLIQDEYPMEIFEDVYYYTIKNKGVTHVDNEAVAWSGNFRSWVQYRQTI